MVKAGINVTDEVMEEFVQFQQKGAYRFLTLKVNDDKTAIVIADKGEKEDTYEKFLEKLPEKEPRFAFYMYEFTVTEGDFERSTSKLVFIYWCPEKSSIKNRMVYSSSKKAVENKLQGLQIKLEASAMDEVVEEAVNKECLKRA
mmetsp:Transcript_10284/g.15039  ORF Transcript_10284/g.15039 Transcript_10284/m.15039 type:complete len:144 (+) Transcript_10284:59-490(+)